MLSLQPALEGTLDSQRQEALAHRLAYAAMGQPLVAYTRLMGLVAGLTVPRPVRGPVFGMFGRALGMDLSEAERDLRDYDSLGDLFARRLKPGLRSVDDSDDTVTSPVDGVVSATGAVADGRLIQAKGIDYSLAELLSDTALACRLDSSRYATIYLRPKDYHRIHAPISGRVVSVRRIAGGLLPVGPRTLRNVRGVFVRNERVVIQMECDAGAVALVCVGASGVGTVTTVFDEGGSVDRRLSLGEALKKGDELAAFNMGSTVVVLWEGPDAGDGVLSLGAEVQMGSVLAKVSRRPAL